MLCCDEYLGMLNVDCIPINEFNALEKFITYN